MDYLPIFLDVRDRPCLVVGGGDVARRKIDLLCRAGARVTVVAPEVCPAVAARVADGGVTHQSRGFEPGDVAGCVAVIAATDDSLVNRQVSTAAQARGIPVNVVDSPGLCSFVMPAIVDRSPLLVAISSGGAAPVLARQLRARLETIIPAAYGRLAALAQTFRGRVKRRFSDPLQRRRFWERIFEGPVAELVLSGRETQAKASLELALQHDEAAGLPRGEVFLVGAGPGDPDLLTFRAMRLMQQADVVVYDRLVSQAIMDLVRRDAERVYVGKERANHALPQEGINQLLVRLAREGKRVLRLKGGDPFVFGRGGEEIETLAAEGIPFQVVPGITAATGCASYAGIPLTHRDHAHACVFVTGHLRDGSLDLNWPELALPHQTVVIYMGLHGVDLICDRLVAHGLPASTLAALVQQGTTPNQRVLTATLGELPALVRDAQLTPPTLMIVGSVVSLREKLAWFEPERNLEPAQTERKEATG